MNLYVKVLDDACMFEKIECGDWIDLKTREKITLEKGESKLIPLGVCMQIPPGYEALLVPRSSTFKHYGIIQTNSIGVIDESYCGDGDEWCMPVYATRLTVIEKGTRLCQFRIIEHQPELKIRLVDHLGNTNRGGFGSTGV